MVAYKLHRRMVEAHKLIYFHPVTNIKDKSVTLYSENLCNNKNNPDRHIGVEK